MVAGAAIFLLLFNSNRMKCRILHAESGRVIHLVQRAEQEKALIYNMANGAWKCSIPFAVCNKSNAESYL
jgi:hypothetical protein